ncbi:GRIP and coiled-coil domain-containing 1-like [Paramuricea clavata]|uniref:GRIP and coiled-coil domain-containing 1-like n=1 Tax=Paramuricea clavata TaxID=317549 RepID=A0A7D9D9P7_PARCT|nr:GRIP and coiled-coil domain-containing 1-like [Paramuricea clavata]
MEKQSKKELLAVIERQGDQLKRFEARLRDVVQAYKGLQKEKNALEKSLRVLSTGGNVDSAEKDSDLDESLNEESENIVKESTSDSTNIQESQHFKPAKTEELQVHDASGDQISLQAQVMTLREALDTIMEQKAKMESSFQADKKKYLHELEMKEDNFAQERDEFCKQKESMLKDIQEHQLLRANGEPGIKSGIPKPH